MKKQLIRMLLAIAVVISAVTIGMKTAKAATQGDWEYTVDGNLQATITAYYGNASSVSIPETLGGYTVKYIDDSVFEGNTALTSVTIPKKIIGIGKCAFKNCVNLKTINYNAESVNDCSLNSINGFDDIDDYWGSAMNSVFYNAGTNTTGMTVTFGNTVKYIPAYLFATGYGKTQEVYCHISKVVFGSSVQEIGDWAFYSCYDLTSVSFPSSMRTVGGAAFNSCTGLKTMTAANGVETFKSGSFCGCISLTTITIPKSTKTIDKCAFKNCVNLKTINYNAESVNDCSSNSINGFDDIDDYWGSAMNSVFYNAGTNTTGMTVTFGNTVKYIPAYLFATGYGKTQEVYCHISKVVFGSSVQEIGDWAFYSCYDLTSVSFPSSMRTVGGAAFNSCTGLKTMTAANGVETFKSGSFCGCISLTTITIPKSTKTIGECAFKNCVNLKSINYNAESVYDCSSNSMNGFDDTDDDWGSAMNSVFYNAGTNTTGMTVTFGNTVKSIPEYLFATGYDEKNEVYANIKTVTIGSNVQSIGKYAFYNCYNLTKITCNSTKAVAGDYVFCNDYRLKVYIYAYSALVNYLKNNGFSYSYLTPTTPSLNKIENTTNGVKITYYSKGNTGYYIYRKSGNGNWTRIATTKSSSYVDKTAKSGTTYTYTVRSYLGKTTSGFVKNGITIKRLADPTVSSASNITAGVQVKWVKTAGATGYVVYRKTGTGSWSRIATIKSGSTTSYIDKSAKSGTNYSYTVRACNGSTMSDWHNYKTVKRLSNPAVTSASKTSNGINVRWSKVTGATGYVVYRKTANGSWSRIANIKSGSTTSYTDTKASKGVTYTYTVRAYNGSTMSSFNSTKSAKR